MMQLSAFLLLLVLRNSVRGTTVLAPAAKATQFITLDIVNGPVAPDGFTRIGVLANGTFPGPLIVATKGQTLVIQINNKLVRISRPYSPSSLWFCDNWVFFLTRINFDGVFIDSDNIFNDGSPGVTTCPVGPGEFCTSTLPLGNQTGSFWYHSQLSVQAVDGLHGTLIIYGSSFLPQAESCFELSNIDPDDPLAHLYDVDDASTVLTVADWWHKTSTSGLVSYLATQINPVPDSGLFNTRGRYNGGPEVEFAAVSVVQGKRYRFRLINIAARSNFVVSIDNHTMTGRVIEADGVATEPHEGNILVIHAGQRYSFVVTANQAVGNYWINAFINGGTRNANLNSTHSRSILRYEGALDEEPQTPMTVGPTGACCSMSGNSWYPSPLSVLVCTLSNQTQPLDPIPAPDPDFNLTFRTFMPENLTAVLHGETQQMDFNVTENTFLFPANKTIKRLTKGTPSTCTAWMNFWVIKSNGSDIINALNPIRRDVVITGNGTIILRFRIDKPGPWFFHCHILYHFAVGLASVIGAGLDKVGELVLPTEAWQRVCPAYDALPPGEQ
ncbi:Cu-oxidase-domain-containing protein [Mycena metata]|uniref:Cu-oxidase-domain-containing protein n=1 Tax=Mycena metata TaxID=1033252 RepID=A0AAD7HFE9_9AGAR|nr:Cu-oxidase-domain-containing protein [Mycena metata]